MSGERSYEVGIARGDQESAAIRAGIAASDKHPWQWGHYVERDDRGEWTPLIYEADSYEDALDVHLSHNRAAGGNGPFRNSRIVRRAVSPWEVVS